MIKGIGVDVIDLLRFKKIISDQDFINQILNDREVSSIILANENGYLNLAKIFAIKEAIMKALGTGLYFGYYWHNIEVSPKWEIKLSGYLKDVYDKLSINKINLSFGYSKNTLTAIVILE